MSIVPFIFNWDLTQTVITIGVSTLFIFGIIMSIIEVKKTKLTIQNNQFIKTRIFSIRILNFTEVKGIRIGQNYIYIIPNNNKKKIGVTKYFEHKLELEGYLLNKYKDLDEIDKINEKNELYTNKKFGKNKKEIKNKVKEVKKITKPLNITGLSLALIHIFSILPYMFSLILNMLICISALILIVRSKGLIQVYSDEESPYPNLNSAVAMPPLAFLYTALVKYNIYDYTIIWILVSIMIVTIMSLFYPYFKDIKVKTLTDKLIVYPIFVIAIGIFSFGFIVQLNCTFDSNNPYITHSKIISKKISKGKNSTSYNITIQDWNNKSKTLSVDVSKTKYSRIKKEENINIEVYPGLFKCPWFKVK